MSITKKVVSNTNDMVRNTNEFRYYVMTVGISSYGYNQAAEFVSKEIRVYTR